MKAEHGVAERCALAVFLALLVMPRSRMGNTAFFASLLLAFGWIALYLEHHPEE